MEIVQVAQLLDNLDPVSVCAQWEEFWRCSDLAPLYSRPPRFSQDLAENALVLDYGFCSRDFGVDAEYLGVRMASRSNRVCPRGEPGGNLQSFALYVWMGFWTMMEVPLQSLSPL